MPLLFAAFTGLSTVVMAQDATPILPGQDTPAVQGTRTTPRKIEIDPVPADVQPSNDNTRNYMPAGAVSFEDILPDPVSPDATPSEARPFKTVGEPRNPVIAPSETLPLPDPPPKAPQDAIADEDPGSDRNAATAPTAATPADPADRFAPCPDELLKAAYARMVSETALATYAIEAEVLRLCADRQAQIKRILAQEADLVKLVAALPGPAAERQGDLTSVRQEGLTSVRQGDLTVTGEATLLPRAPVTVPAAPGEDDPAVIAPGGIAVRAAVSSSNAGTWRHLVRYRVRTDGGAWRAGIASTFQGPARQVRLDDGTVTLGPLPAADPPLEVVVAAGDRLKDGLIVEAVTDAAVTVRDPGADDEPWELRNDPGDADTRVSGDAACPAGGSGQGAGHGGTADLDPRDFVYCTVEMQ